VQAGDWGAAAHAADRGHAPSSGANLGKQQHGAHADIRSQRRPCMALKIKTCYPTVVTSPRTALLNAGALLCTTGEPPPPGSREFHICVTMYLFYRVTRFRCGSYAVLNNRNSIAVMPAPRGAKAA
jgi:hypothetical protein